MLEDIIVLDLSRILAGPYSTMTLGDLGAEVIKVESLSGDDTRGWGPPFYKEDAAYYLCCNRNKKSMTVDFTTLKGQEIIHLLAEKADVFVENYKVGGLRKYGLDYESIHKINPSIIYCSITGYGQTGPYREKPGYDFIIQGLSGLMSITGEVEGTPMKLGVAISDILAAHSATTSILAALYRRQKTGEGEYIDISLLDTSVASLVNVASGHLVSEREAKRYGNAHPNIVPYESFIAKDGYLNIAVGNNSQFSRLCQVIGLPELATDERFKNNADRVKNREILIPKLNEVLSKKGVSVWLQVLEAHQIPAGAINTVGKAFSDQQIKARNMVTTISRSSGEAIKLVSSPLKFKNFKADIHSLPPALGEHTDEVLENFLGMTPEQILQLRKEKII
jgi:formyl-CoA transferase